MLGDRVRDVVPIDPLAVAVDPGRNDAEAIKRRAAPRIARFEIKRFGFPVERDHDPTFALRGARIVFQAPIATLAVRRDREKLAHAWSFASPQFRAHDGIKPESIAARPLDL